MISLAFVKCEYPVHFLGKKMKVKCITATYRAGLSASVLLEIKAIIKLSLKEIIVLYCMETCHYSTAQWDTFCYSKSLEAVFLPQRGRRGS